MSQEIIYLTSGFQGCYEHSENIQINTVKFFIYLQTITPDLIFNIKKNSSFFKVNYSFNLHLKHMLSVSESHDKIGPAVSQICQNRQTVRQTRIF